MNYNVYRVAFVTAIMPLLVGGCAIQAGATTETAKPVESALPVAASTPPADNIASQSAKAKHPLRPPSELETLNGIQIAHIGLTAAGGLVDVRFKVLDAAKVKKLLADPANAPTLKVGENPPLAAPHHAMRGAKFADGLIFYILYPNARNAIKTGVEVTVAMGDVRLGRVTVQ